MKIHENSELGICSLLRACWLYMVDIYREPREWKTVLQTSDGKSVIWSCGVVSHTFHYPSAFHNELEECSICYHRIPALRSDSLTMIIPLFGALFPIPERLPDLQHGHFRQNILPSLATSMVCCESLLDLSR